MNKKIKAVVIWALGLVSVSAIDGSSDASQQPLHPPTPISMQTLSPNPIPDSDSIQNAITHIRSAKTLDTLDNTVADLRNSLSCPSLGTIMFDRDLKKHPHLQPVAEAIFDQMCRIQRRGKYRPNVTTNSYDYVAQSGWLGMFYGFHLALQLLFSKD